MVCLYGEWICYVYTGMDWWQMKVLPELIIRISIDLKIKFVSKWTPSTLLKTRSAVTPPTRNPNNRSSPPTKQYLSSHLERLQAQFCPELTPAQSIRRAGSRLHAFLQLTVLRKVLQSQSAVSHPTDHSGLHSHQEIVHLKNQTQSWFLRSLLGPHHHHLPPQLHRQPLPILLQLVTRRLYLPALTCQVWRCYCLQLWVWRPRFALFCYEVHGIGVIFAAGGILFAILVNLHLWVLIWVLFGCVLAVYCPLGLAALAAHGLRNGQLDCVFDIEHGWIHGRAG